MGRPRKQQTKKDEFEDLDEVFKAEVLANVGNEPRIREIISKNAVNSEIFKEQMKVDPHVQATKEAATEAKRPYTDGVKGCSLRIRFCRKSLKDAGHPLAGTDET